MATMFAFSLMVKQVVEKLILCKEQSNSQVLSLELLKNFTVSNPRWKLMVITEWVAIATWFNFMWIILLIALVPGIIHRLSSIRSRIVLSSRLERTLILVWFKS